MFNTNLFASKTEKLEAYTPNKAPCRVRLDANESGFSMDERIISEMKAALSDIDFNRYPDPDAEALCEAFAKVYDLDKKNVIAANGSDELLSIIANSLLEKGDKILTLHPDFSMYAFYGSLAELETPTFEKGEGFKVDFAALGAEIKKLEARLVIFSNPCNPTGILEKKSDIEKLIADNPRTIFVMDEAYLDFACMRDFDRLCDDGYSFLHDTEKYPNMFVIKTMSKAFGAAALRVGFAVGDKCVADTFRKVKSPYNVNSVSQMLGKIILSHPDILEENTRAIVKNADRLKRELLMRGFECVNSNTNFVFAPCAFADEMFAYLCETGIFIRKFTLPTGKYLRITAGTDEDISILLEYIDKYMEERK